MENQVAVKILDELREFRKENNERWEANDKRWEENEKRWEANEKRWEENEKRWEANEKRWEENEKRWEENSKRWNQNDKKWAENDKRLDSIEDHLKRHDEDISKLLEFREKDRKELFEVLDTMQKSITDQISELKEDMDAKFDRFGVFQIINDIEHRKYKENINKNAAKLNFYNSRIEYLENWKREMDNGEFFAV